MSDLQIVWLVHYWDTHDHEGCDIVARLETAKATKGVGWSDWVETTESHDERRSFESRHPSNPGTFIEIEEQAVQP